jgi:hypothetical protein
VSIRSSAGSAVEPRIKSRVQPVAALPKFADKAPAAAIGEIQCFLTIHGRGICCRGALISTRTRFCEFRKEREQPLF